jgi:hypothetical protein
MIRPKWLSARVYVGVPHEGRAGVVAIVNKECDTPGQDEAKSWTMGRPIDRSGIAKQLVDEYPNG